MVLHRGSGGGNIGKEFPSQRQLTLNYTKLIRKIYKRDNRLTPKQQQLAIIALPGISSNEMESLMKSTGPKLAAELRKFISKHRARTRSIKQKARKAKGS